MALRAPYTRLLYRRHALDIDELTPDPAYEWVLRHIAVFFPDITGGQFQMIDAHSATVVNLQTQPYVRGLSLYQDVRIALPAGETFALQGDGSPDVYLTAYRFLLPG